MIPARTLERYCLALAVGSLGMLNILCAWLAHHPVRVRLLSRVLPHAVLHATWVLTTLAGTGLVLLAWGLARGKRRAWQLAAGLLVLAAAAHLLKGRHHDVAALDLTALVVLLARRRTFRATSDPPALKQALAAAAAWTGAIYLYALLGLYLMDRYFHVSLSLTLAASAALRLLVGSLPAAANPPTLHAAWFLDSLLLLEVSGVATVFLLLFRPVAYRWVVEPAARQRTRAILRRHGRSAIAHLTLLPDKAYYFAPSGAAFLAYRLVGNVAVVLGDPVGPPEEMEAAIKGFAEICSHNDWQPVFYQVLPDYLEIYSRLGFKHLKIGEEAVMDLSDFDLAGSRWKTVRQAVNRALRRGYRTRLILPPVDDATMAALKEVSDEWLRHRKGGEKMFSLGWFEPDYLRQTPVMVVEDERGKIQAFANIIPTYQLGQGTIDLMRRRTDADNGVMELLFVALARYFRAQGHRAFNLGLAPLAGLRSDQGPLAERTLALVFDRFNYFYRFQGLKRFKEKFHPRWEPRYLVYPGTLALPKAGLAVVRANAGGSLRAYFKRPGFTTRGRD